jgi:hypothetical protein
MLGWYEQDPQTVGDSANVSNYKGTKESGETFSRAEDRL